MLEVCIQKFNKPEISLCYNCSNKPAKCVSTKMKFMWMQQNVHVFVLFSTRSCPVLYFVWTTNLIEQIDLKMDRWWQAELR